MTYVYKVTKDTAYATPITVVERANNIAVVKDGVKKGDKVVAQGVGKLRDKTAVKPMPANFDTIVNSTKTVF